MKPDALSRVVVLLLRSRPFRGLLVVSLLAAVVTLATSTSMAALRLSLEQSNTAYFGATQAVLQVKIDLGAIKGAIALVDGIGYLHLIQRLLQRADGQVPHLIRANAVFRSGGQFHFVGETKVPVDPVLQFIHADDLVLDLLWRHIQVGIILGESAHAHQAMQRA